MKLIMRKRHAVGSSGACQAHKMFRSDIGSEDRSTDNEPPEVTAGKKIIFGIGFLLFPYRPYGNAGNDKKVKRNDSPVEPGKIIHKQLSLFVGNIRYSFIYPARFSVFTTLNVLHSSLT